MIQELTFYNLSSKVHDNWSERIFYYVFMIKIYDTNSKSSIKIFLNYHFPYSACLQYACAQFLLFSLHRILRWTQRLD